MTQTDYTCRGGRPSGARRPGAARMATRRTRVRVSSDAVVSAYIRDIARPPGGEEQHDLTRHHPGHRPRAWRPPLQRSAEATTAAAGRAR